mmetsp:Transcript_29656/g.65731  ORF Transcript_29656/g.65731 Transcript_29656/m.65731 type:complete len:817 (-) Transcript_29656:1546-3996(-)
MLLRAARRCRPQLPGCAVLSQSTRNRPSTFHSTQLCGLSTIQRAQAPRSFMAKRVASVSSLRSASHSSVIAAAPSSSMYSREGEEESGSPLRDFSRESDLNVTFEQLARAQGLQAAADYADGLSAVVSPGGRSASTELAADAFESMVRCVLEVDEAVAASDSVGADSALGPADEYWESGSGSGSVGLSNTAKWALNALVRLAGSNTIHDVRLRGRLLMELARAGHFDEAVEMTKDSVKHFRWIGVRTLNMLLQHGSDPRYFGMCGELLLRMKNEKRRASEVSDKLGPLVRGAEDGPLSRKLAAAALVKTFFIKSTLGISSSSPASSSPALTSPASSSALDSAPSPFSALDSALAPTPLGDSGSTESVGGIGGIGVTGYTHFRDDDIIAQACTLLPPADLEFGPTLKSYKIYMQNIVSLYAHGKSQAQPEATELHSCVQNAVGELLARLQSNHNNVHADMELLTSVAQLGYVMEDSNIVGKAVECAYQMGELSSSQRMLLDPSILYSWQLGQPAIGERSEPHYNPNRAQRDDKRNDSARALEADGGVKIVQTGAHLQPTHDQMCQLLHVQIILAMRSSWEPVKLGKYKEITMRMFEKKCTPTPRMISTVLGELLLEGDYVYVQRIYEALLKHGAQRNITHARMLLESLSMQARLLDASKALRVVLELQAQGEEADELEWWERDQGQGQGLVLGMEMVKEEKPTHLKSTTYQLILLKRLLQHLANLPSSEYDKGRHKISYAELTDTILLLVSIALDQCPADEPLYVCAHACLIPPSWRLRFRSFAHSSPLSSHLSHFPLLSPYLPPTGASTLTQELLL